LQFEEKKVIFALSFGPLETKGSLLNRRRTLKGYKKKKGTILVYFERLYTILTRL